jgi:colanic acid/amylovoran biosynthesis glycosyltransferase
MRKDRLKVLHFVETWLPPTENWIYNHIRFLPCNVESGVVCQWSQNVEEFPMERLFSLESPPRASSLLDKVLFRLRLQDDIKRHLPLLGKVIREFRPDILHSHFGHFGAINAALAREYGIRHVVSFYGLEIGYLPKIQSRWISRYRKMGNSADMVLCEGPHMRRCISELGIPADKIKVFRLGIDLTRIPWKPRMNPSPGTIRFLIAGTFREKKGIPYALEALGLFSKKQPNFTVTVIGDAGGSDREKSEKQTIYCTLDRWSLREKVHFLGYQSHDSLVEQFYLHDIFLSPSVTAADGDTEGGAPVTIIEAAASGMPVVSTSHCDIPFVLSERNSPYLAPERDALALSIAIEKLLGCADWAPIASANRELIDRELDVRKQARGLGRIYKLVKGWQAGQ